MIQIKNNEKIEKIDFKCLQMKYMSSILKYPRKVYT